MSREPQKLIDNLTDVLYPEYMEKLVNPLWAKRKLEIQNIHKSEKEAAETNFWPKYEEQAKKLRSTYGYGEHQIGEQEK